ncbi:hypothetical protein DHD08_17635 [Arenibacter sp. H213]|nr:hypothetical protein [Arenibacter sp. H213]
MYNYFQIRWKQLLVEFDPKKNNYLSLGILVLLYSVIKIIQELKRFLDYLETPYYKTSLKGKVVFV